MRGKGRLSVARGAGLKAVTQYKVVRLVSRLPEKLADNSLPQQTYPRERAWETGWEVTDCSGWWIWHRPPLLALCKTARRSTACFLAIKWNYVQMLNKACWPATDPTRRNSNLLIAATPEPSNIGRELFYLSIDFPICSSTYLFTPPPPHHHQYFDFATKHIEDHTRPSSVCFLALF